MLGMNCGVIMCWLVIGFYCVVLGDLLLLFFDRRGSCLER